VTAVEHHEDRALRADAQRNLRRVLDAAREVFAEQGSEASVTAIAERAGVGVATIFRRFPTKDDLLGAILEQRLDELVDAADAALVDGGLRAFMTAAVAAADISVLVTAVARAGLRLEPSAPGAARSGSCSTASARRRRTRSGTGR
jgi:AcrR family transcriptional regulator